MCFEPGRYSCQKEITVELRWLELEGTDKMCWNYQKLELGEVP